jgi:hypothetical protein
MMKFDFAIKMILTIVVLLEIFHLGYEINSGRMKTENPSPKFQLGLFDGKPDHVSGFRPATMAPHETLQEKRGAPVPDAQSEHGWFVSGVVTFFTALGKWLMVFFSELFAIFIHYASIDTLVVLILITAFCYQLLRNEDFRMWLASKGLDLMVKRKSPSALRSRFQRYGFVPNPMALEDPNPHAEAAATRSQADGFVEDYARDMGLTLFSVSKSPKDAWKGISGTRYYYHEKDLRMAFSEESRPPPNLTLMKLVDVDYYLRADVIRKLVINARATMMYTVLPDTLASHNPEGTVTFDEKGEMTQAHAGSTPYVHELWNWRKDYITFTAWTFSNALVHCYIDYKKVAENRYLVLITPVAHGNIFARLIWWLVGNTRPLERWKPVVVNGVSLLYGPEHVTIAGPGRVTQHKVTVTQFAEMLSNTHLNAADVVRLTGDKTAYELTELMTKLQNGKLPPALPTTFEARTLSYKPEYLNVFDNTQVKHVGRDFMPPFIGGRNFIAARCKSSDLMCLNERLWTTQAELRSLPRKYSGYMNEFVELAIPEKGCLHPLSFGEVLAQANPVQRNKWAEAIRGPDSDIHASHQKIESYNEVKPPRNISCVNPQHVAQMSRYTIPFSNLFKAVPWYAFGAGPVACGQAVKNLTSDFNSDGSLVEGDFSRYDGRQTTWCVDLNTRLMLRAYKPDEAETIRELRYKLSHALFTTGYGVKYNSADSQKSGSATTSIDNTITHAFCQYSHFRNIGYEPKQAYLAIGLCAGDDGLLRTPNPSDYEKTCNRMGLKLKSNVLCPGVPASFLGRCWPDWSAPNSHADPLRALSKFHHSTESNPNVPVEQLAWRKAAGYYVTDSGNMIGHIARKILVLTAPSAKGKPDIAYWLKDAVNPADVTPQRILGAFADHAVFNTNRCNPEDLLMPNGRYDPCFLQLCDQTQLSKAKVMAWYKKVMACKSLSDMPLLTTFYPDPPSTDVTINGKICGPTIASAGDKDYPLPKPSAGEAVKVTTPPVSAPTPAPKPNESSPSAIPTPVPKPAAATPSKPAKAADAAFVCRKKFHTRKCDVGEDACPHLHTWPNACLNHLNNKCTRVPCKYRHLTLSERPPRVHKEKRGGSPQAVPGTKTAGPVQKTPTVVPTPKAEAKPVPAPKPAETIIATVVVKCMAKPPKAQKPKAPKVTEPKLTVSSTSKETKSTKVAQPKLTVSSTPKETKLTKESLTKRKLEVSGPPVAPPVAPKRKLVPKAQKGPSAKPLPAPVSKGKKEVKARPRKSECTPLLEGDPPPVYDDGEFTEEFLQLQERLIGSYSGCSSSTVVNDSPVHSVNYDAPPPSQAPPKTGLQPAPVRPDVLPPICYSWLKGRCLRKNCKFIHSKNGVCHAFLDGECNATHCQFKHVSPSLDA